MKGIFQALGADEAIISYLVHLRHVGSNHDIESLIFSMGSVLTTYVRY